MPKLLTSLSTILLSALPLAAGDAPGAPGELVMLAPLDQTMPIVRFSNGVLAGGIIKDVGDALAQRLGRRAVYLSVDVAGVTPALTSGRADAMCYVLPFWIDGDYDWSMPLLPDTEMVVARADAPRLRSLKDLKDTPIGTVAGYRYPRVEQVLGRQFARTDAASMDLNVQQMIAGKVQYTLAGESTLFYLQRIHPQLKLRPELVFSSFKAQCAFSRKSQVPFNDANRAIDALLREGVIDQILARYR
ncbi:ABC transporter substrate-binding protein [Duganella sp. HH105]|uniref:substrate-binding periplasmic protein n=1 Tax=Duganella sp. HH105 TaxID=1781067 RepID=UPI000877E27D|nr:transporter substrate-binding domain-containing protein [Duganella sp. HH105]OEZ56300.1 bacterial extracellular solute-binding protein, family 3 [Duganella sp. HH105]